tara:strand:- start:7627 stop:8460 length:834 start_codon:yes stop_codon:yes gene_type:complete
MTKYRTLYLLIILLFLAGGLFFWRALSPSGKLPEAGMAGSNGNEAMTALDRPDICEETVFEGARASLCIIDPAANATRLVYRDRTGVPHGSVKRAVTALATFGQTPVLAMNAGMYHSDMTPVGLYVEDGKEISPLNTDDDFGNFFLKPNGVFFIRPDGTAGVMETMAYAGAEIAPAFATQSGPMLVINGEIHPRFLPDGTTRYIRNGVGVRTDGKLVLAITRDPVSLGSFARLFRDVAMCPNALFFDGGVSSMAWGAHMEIDAGEPAGPVVVVMLRD